MRTLQIGHTFNDRYEVLGLLGRGGMGSVYRCRDPKLEREVAVKVLDWRSDDSLRQRLEREARIVASLAHPGIVGVYDIGFDDDNDVLFVVQELLDGSDLSSVLATSRGNGLPRAIAAKVFFSVADALTFAHSKGVVHRDVKPSNIRLLPAGTVKVLDFGVAIARQFQGGITQAGTQIGTPAYMSPEQLKAQPVDARSDIYSLAAVCYEVLTGRMPFKADSPFELGALVLAQDGAPPMEAWDVPADVAAVIEGSLRKNRDERPPRMEHLAQTFSAWLKRFDEAEILTLWPVRHPSARAFDAERLREGVPAETGSTLIRRPAEVRRPPIVAGVPEATAASPQSSSPAAYVERRQLPLDQNLAGYRVGRFTLHELVARGRSGPFYKAYDPVRGTLIGLKLVDGRDTEIRDRLFRAGRLWLELRHSSLVSVLELHPDCGDYGAIASELVDGIPLSSLRDHPQLSLEHIISIGLQLCGALAYMHDRGIIHREVCPRNVLVQLPDCRIKLLDSGIARHANPEIDAFTQTGVVVGDLTYAAPELFEGRGNQRADLFAVGAVLHELLTGRQFDAMKPWPSRRVDTLKEIAPPLRSIIERALDSDPSNRFATAHELAEKLQAIVPQKSAPARIDDAVITLHGIRTNARWQRAFVEVANRAGLDTRLDRWNFGYFSSFRFLLPWARRSKVRWFRTTFELEFPGVHAMASRPSVIAHSFGTYIVGYALLRYPYLRVNRVLLCGSILPTTFPWDVLLERGQVQAVRNEYGSEDVWTKLVHLFIPGTGRSGVVGFVATHPRLEQERFTFAHSEYFERGHMANNWLPFLKRRLEHMPPRDSVGPTHAGGATPWGLYILYAVIVVSTVAAISSLL